MSRSCSPDASGCARSSRTRTSASRLAPAEFTISELRDLYRGRSRTRRLGDEPPARAAAAWRARADRPAARIRAHRRAARLAFPLPDAASSRSRIQFAVLRPPGPARLPSRSSPAWTLERTSQLVESVRDGGLSEATSAPGFGAHSRDRSPTSKPCSDYHWPRAYRAAYLVVHDSAAAEDIAQEAFLAAVRALDRFDRRRPFGPWLHRIVVNRAIDWSRARALRRESGTPGSASSTPCPADERARTDAALRALADLSPEHRAVIVLRHLSTTRRRDRAGLLDLPRGTVNSAAYVAGSTSLAELLEGGSLQ